MFQNRHADVVRRNCQAEVKTERCLLNNDEQRSLGNREEMEQETKVERKVNHQTNQLDDSIVHLLAQQEANAICLEIDGFEQQQGEEKIGLTVHNPLAHPGFLQCLVLRESED